MAEIGMCFQAPLVRAFLAGRKSQTRRSLSAARCLVDGWGYSEKRWAAMDWDWSTASIDTDPRADYDTEPHVVVMSRADGTKHVITPRPKAGDRMWVRETWSYTTGTLDEARAITEDIMSGTALNYRATFIDDYVAGGMSRKDATEVETWETWRPSIHMPRWAARIERDIVGLRFERLHDISEADALAEGIHERGDGFRQFGEFVSMDAVGLFRTVWESIHGAGSWDANPMLLVYDFAEVRHG